MLKTINHQLQMELTVCYPILENQIIGCKPPPVVVPRVCTAYSLMCEWGKAKRAMTIDITPPSTIALVCSDFPKLILMSVFKQIEIQ